jgi:hypothetical protein
MSELKEGPETVPGSSEVTWPDAAAVARAGEEGTELSAGLADSAVAAAVRHLGRLPGLPVARHGALYEEMHDALLEALNEDPSPRPGTA